MATAAPMTAEELLLLQLPHKRSELVLGVLNVREPAGFRHGAIAMRIALKVGNYVDQHQLGVVVAAETGFTLRRDPDTVRAADVAFISRERAPIRESAGFAELAPDLVVEVLSPDDRPESVLAKCADWLGAGCRLVWLVDPARREARVFRADGTLTLLGAHDSLDGEDVLPGFTCPVESLWG